MRVARVLLVLAALPLLLTPALGQNAPHELYGELFSIENGEQSPKFFPNVQVTIREFDVSGLTNDQGAFRIRLPAAVLPGQEVTLRHDKEGYAIFSPLLGRLTIPAHSNEVVEVRLLPLDSPLFWSHDRIEEFIKRNANDTAKQTKGKESLWAAVLRRVQSIWRWYTELNTFLQATLGATAMYALLALTMGGFWLIRPSLLAHWAMPSLTASESPQWKGIVEAVALVRWLGTTQRALDAWLRQYDGALDARCFEGRKSVAGRPLSQYVDLERAEQIGAWKQALARGEPLACWVVGPGGCGKTTLALMLARHARATTKLYPVRPVLVEEDWGKDLTEHVARLLCVGDRRPSMAMVHKLGHTGRLIPVIDGLSERRVERAADQVKDLVVGGVFRRLVVTSRSGPPDGDWFQSLSVGPVPPDRVDDFLRAYGIGDDSRPGAVAEIAELSGSQPVRALFLKLSADQLLKGQDLPTSYPGLVRAFVVGSRPSGTDALREGDFLRAAGIAAYRCIVDEETIGPHLLAQSVLRAALIDRAAAEPFLTDGGKELDSVAVLDQLIGCGLLQRSVEVARALIGFAEDPIAEYLAAMFLHEAEDRRVLANLRRRKAWKDSGLAEAVERVVDAARNSNSSNLPG